MDSTCIEINSAELIAFESITSNWRAAIAVRPFRAPRPIELLASCPQGALASVRPAHTGLSLEHHTEQAMQISKQQDRKQQDPQFVMGGSYVADDTFGTRWGSRPGRPPE